MAPTIEHDVIVLGGGPAGAAAALRLAEVGLDVAVVERARFPRSHVGICLSDETVRLIDHLGLLQQLDMTEPCPRNVTAVKWGEAKHRLIERTGCHVDRGKLDQLMLFRARSTGATVYQPARLLETASLGERGWRLLFDCNGERRSIVCRFVIDAAGRRGATRGTRVKDSPPLLCIHASWQLTRVPEFDGCIEAGQTAWLWFASTSRDQAVVSVFCDPRRLSEPTLQGNYNALLRQFAAPRLEHIGAQRSPALACDAGSHHAATPLDAHSIRIGDACHAVDPLSSQGVHLALQSGLQAAVIVNTLLRRPSDADAAMAFYRARVAERVAHYVKRTRQEYARVVDDAGEAFWGERAKGAVAAAGSDHRPPTQRGSAREVGSPPIEPVSLSTELVLTDGPVIGDEFVEVRPVAHHPGLGRAVAYIGGVDLPRLLSMLPPTIDYAQIPEHWRSQIPPQTSREIASWLWSRGVLVNERGTARR